MTISMQMYDIDKKDKRDAKQEIPDKVIES